MNKSVLSTLMGTALACSTVFSQPEPQQRPGNGRGMRPQFARGQEQGRGPQMGPEARPGMAGGGMRGRPGSKLGEQSPHLNPRRLKAAGASEQQIKAIEELQFERQSKQIDLRAAAEKAELALEQLIKSDADEATALKAAETLNQARGELFKLMVSTRLKTRKLLGDELLQKLTAPPPGECPLRDNPPGPSDRNP